MDRKGDKIARMPPRWNIAPVFLVKDVVAAANHYRDKLGFQYERFWGDPPSFCMVKRAGIVIMLSQRQPDAPQQGGPNRLADAEGELWDAYIWVEDADALHQEFSRAGVNITRGLCDQPYGNRDFDVEDLDGYRVCFGSDIPKG